MSELDVFDTRLLILPPKDLAEQYPQFLELPTLSASEALAIVNDFIKGNQSSGVVTARSTFSRLVSIAGDHLPALPKSRPAFLKALFLLLQKLWRTFSTMKDHARDHFGGTLLSRFRASGS